ACSWRGSTWTCGRRIAERGSCRGGMPPLHSGLGHGTLTMQATTTTRTITIHIGRDRESHPRVDDFVEWGRRLAGADVSARQAFRDSRVALGAMLWQIKDQAKHGEFR